MNHLVDQPTAKPSRKVVGGTLGGAVAIIVIAIINRFIMPEGEAFGVEVSGAITVLVGSAVAYFVRERNPLWSE